MKTRTTMGIAGLVGISLILAACASSSPGTADETVAGEPSTSAECAAYAEYGTFDGATVTMYSGIVAPDDQP